MTLGEALPRDPSEAITIHLEMPGVPGDAAKATVVIRRGFVGIINQVEYGSVGYEGRQRVSARIVAWDGDTPMVRYGVKRA